MTNHATQQAQPEAVLSSAELGFVSAHHNLRPKIRGSELTLHMALHIMRNPFPFDQRERDLVRLWAADELERLSVLCMNANKRCAQILEQIAIDEPVSGNQIAQARVLMAADRLHRD